MVVYGYSGAARATEFAAELAPDYAPELDIHGVAAGGLLLADVAATAELMRSGLFSGISMSALFGLAAPIPS
ncbi:lipase family protein [Nocardia sp. CA-128927]|uniref:lipase family protein n=1 Tax=Nocardia sp. CA-128927 TaxID=3239975 RepID=UPI003D95F878